MEKFGPNYTTQNTFKILELRQYLKIGKQCVMLTTLPQLDQKRKFEKKRYLKGKQL